MCKLGVFYIFTEKLQEEPRIGKDTKKFLRTPRTYPQAEEEDLDIFSQTEGKANIPYQAAANQPGGFDKPNYHERFLERAKDNFPPGW